MPDNELLVDEIRRAVAGQISPYSFDSIVATVAADFGRTELNLEKFRANHQKAWIESLVKLQEGYDFQFESRRLVEQSFLANPEKSPVTGLDIMRLLGVPQGREVGILVGVGQQVFDSGIRDKAQILKRLREHLSSTVGEKQT
jgi:hypothetical protein